VCSQTSRTLENSRDERDSVNLDTPWLTETDGQAQEVLLTPMAGRLAGFRAFVPSLGQKAPVSHVAPWRPCQTGLQRAGMGCASSRPTSRPSEVRKFQRCVRRGHPMRRPILPMRRHRSDPSRSRTPPSGSSFTDLCHAPLGARPLSADCAHAFCALGRSLLSLCPEPLVWSAAIWRYLFNPCVP
jgi:hypothetical protein